MNQNFNRVVKFSTQELSSISRGSPGLSDERFPQWVVTINQIIIAAIETLNQGYGGYPRKFPC